jgi:hypothetical protein
MDAEEDARAYLADCYAWLGEDIVSGAAEDAEAVRRFVAEFDAAGCDELIFVPSASDPDQVDLLADAGL